MSLIGCSQYLLKLPADPGIVLPGLWMLFVIDAAGVPSVSRDIRIKTQPATAAQPVATPAATTAPAKPSAESAASHQPLMSAGG